MTALTPEEAKQQTCPLIRYCINQRDVLDGRDAIYEHQACQGPDCKIGWRWAEPGTHFDERIVLKLSTPTHGYCGAFGRTTQYE